MSLLSHANSDRTTAIDAHGNASNAYINRREFNKQQEAAEDANESAQKGSALSMGISVGMYTANPVLGVAAGVGTYLLGGLF